MLILERMTFSRLDDQRDMCRGEEGERVIEGKVECVAHSVDRECATHSVPILERMTFSRIDDQRDMCRG